MMVFLYVLRSLISDLDNDIRNMDGKMLVEDLEDLSRGEKGRASVRPQKDAMNVDSKDDDSDSDDGLTMGSGIHRDR